MFARFFSGFRHFWFRSIQRQLSLAFALSTALLMFGFGTSIVWQERGFLLDQSAHFATDLAHTVSHNSTSWVVANDVAGLQEVLMSVAQIPNLEYAFVLSPQGQVLASTREKDIGRYVDDQVSLDLLKTAAVEPLVLVDGFRQIDVAAPVLAGKRMVGWVRIGWGRKEVADNLRGVTQWGMAMAGLAIVIVILVAQFISWGLTSRLRQLMRAANLVTAGRRDVRANVTREDEVARLATNFNRMLDALVESEQRLALSAAVFEHSLEGIMVTDATGKILSINRGFSDITGFDEADVLGKNPRMLASGSHGPAFYKSMWDEIGTSGYWQGEIINRRKQGEIYPEWLSITSVKGEGGRIDHYIGIFSDISERKVAQDHIHHLAHYDALTDLPNRILMRDRLEQSIIKAQRSHKKVALLFLDLDRFKTINDTLGHGVGDKVLKAVAGRLMGCVREQDTVSRQGGDEFIVILPDTDMDGVVQVVNKMLDVLASPFLVEQHDLRVTTSVGIAIYPDDAADIDTLVRLADVAMYNAKDSGRNNYQFYNAGMNASAMERLKLESGLRAALANNQLALHYQPQVDLASGAIVGCEALIRWMHPEFGMVPPARFIPVAEECGLIVEIGAWVMDEACRQNRAWQAEGLRPLVVGINISALQFRQRGLQQTVAHALSKHGLEACYLELELTESIVMHGLERTLDVLRELTDSGVQLSIDDFGTGYSSLSYLKRFPIHRLKIDQSFVRDIVTDSNDAAIVRTIILMAHSLNLRVIAEGVETAEQLAFLKAAGCDEIQGYFFSRPVPAENFAELLRAGKVLTANLPPMVPAGS